MEDDSSSCVCKPAGWYIGISTLNSLSLVLFPDCILDGGESLASRHTRAKQVRTPFYHQVRLDGQSTRDIVYTHSILDRVSVCSRAN